MQTLLQRSLLSAAVMVEMAMRAALSRAPDMEVWRWLEQNVKLTERESQSEPGQFSTSRRPYVREPLECFRDKRVTDLALCFGTQTAKTLTVMGGTAWKMCNDPMNTLWVMPNRDLAESFARNRWLPFVDGCAPLAMQKPRDRHLWKTLEQFFMRATLNFVGSNSPANLASRPAGLLLMDEIDKFDLRSDREAGALQNAEERTKSFPYPLRVKTSTPTTKEGEIWKEFLDGDQRYFYLPCPTCHVPIRLIWDQVKWWRKSEDESMTKTHDGKMVWDMDKVRRNTFYRCQNCEDTILNSQKEDMLREGEWRPHNLEALMGRRSYHLNSLYAPLKETQWGNLAVKFLLSKGAPSRRQAFINSTLAGIYDDEHLVDDAPLNTVDIRDADLPLDRIAVMTVDVQENHFWVVVREWGHPKAEGGQQSWLRFGGRVETPEELEALQAKFNVEGRNVGVDMAHRPNMVAALLVKNGWNGLWGSDRLGFTHTLPNGYKVIREYSKIEFRDPHLGTIYQSEQNIRAPFVYWSGDRIKDRLEVLRFEEPARWHVDAGVSKDYVHQLNSEIKTSKISPKTGRITFYWRQVRKANHLRDCEAMQIVLTLKNGILEDEASRQANTQIALGLEPEFG